ncbi:TrmB family transcriptional regulator [Haloarcula pelagica]|uniref:TrmB family transcriptional regulator n=1 Tax=Haloarcula pelagica TaxID=3033389 RepID=UPI0024C3A55C|nr:TrmB family transcriptional regulator [Halomicroarcula sp. YJ-61-S]
MVQIELTSSQQRTLTALVNRHQSADAPVKGRVIADEIDRNLGTVQNQMQSLAALGLVESVSGPSGGYEPTDLAYEAIGRDRTDDAESVTLAREYERVDVTVEEINLTGVHHPEKCQARVHLQDSVAQFDVGQAVALGPTPVAGLVVAGTVKAVDTTNNQLVVDVAQLEAPVEPPE